MLVQLKLKMFVLPVWAANDEGEVYSLLDSANEVPGETL
jgi:hypothetical protein